MSEKLVVLVAVLGCLIAVVSFCDGFTETTCTSCFGPWGRQEKFDQVRPLSPSGKYDLDGPSESEDLTRIQSMARNKEYKRQDWCSAETLLTLSRAGQRSRKKPFDGNTDNKCHTDDESADVVLQMLNKFRSKCKSYYPKMVKSLENTMDREQLIRVENFIEYLQTAGRSIEDPERKMSVHPNNPEIILYSHKYPEVLFRAIMSMAQSELESNPSSPFDAIESRDNMDRDSFKNNYENYLVKPCQHYFSKLDYYFFEPIFSGNTKLNIEKSLEDREYYLSYTRYMVCYRLLVSAETPSSNLFERILSSGNLD